MKIRAMSNKLLAFSIVVLSTVLVTLLSYFYLYVYSVKPASPDITQVFKKNNKVVFEPVLPGRKISFPRAFGFFNEFQHEEWNYFATLEGDDNKRYSVQWRYFRVARDEGREGGWNSSQLYMSHIVVSSEDGVWKQQRMARGGIGQAGFRARPFRLWTGDWSWRSLSMAPFPGILNVTTDEFSLQLTSSSTQPFILNGDNGYRSQHDLLPIASYGYQTPSILSAGFLTIGGKQIGVRGKAWLAKEWGSELDAVKEQKLVRMNLHLEGGQSLQVDQIRVPHYMPYNYGVLIRADGNALPLSSDELSIKVVEYMDTKNSKRLPLKWLITIPKLNIAVTVKAENAAMWHDFAVPYWQGEVSGTGSHSARGVLLLNGF